MSSSRMMEILSLGGGVQSTTVLLMSLHGDLEPLDAAIFADTQDEPAAVYRHIAQFADISIPLHFVTAGHIAEDALSPDGRFAPMPYHVRNESGKPAMIKRQCSNEYKLKAIHRKARELCGLKPRQMTKGAICRQWLGISLDEAHRMTESREKWAVLYYPLIEKRMTRHDCIVWLTRHGYPIPPKSACKKCPFHSDAYWRDMRDNRPDEWAETVAFDREIRGGNVRFGKEGLKGQAYLHRSCNPLDEVDLRTAEDHGQEVMFGNECTGICGV